MNQTKKIFQQVPTEEECLNQKSRNISLLKLGVA
jgi:hypothetical protein